MDWDSKLPPWDITELEQTQINHNNRLAMNPTSVVSLASGPHFTVAPPQLLSKECSIDLKLGGSTGLNSQSRVTASATGPAKRARVPANQGQPIASCLVDGCISDLSNCREYHRRHKVCEIHSKTPIVLVGGVEQRFCQQCSRFHLLGEFDEVKRSCRKRLDGHNRRRRKPQPDPVTSHSSFFSNHQGRIFPNYPQIFPASLPDPTWSVPTSKTEQQSFFSYSVNKSQPPAFSVNKSRHLPLLVSKSQPPPFSVTFTGNHLKDSSKLFPFMQEPATTGNGMGNGNVSVIPKMFPASSESSSSNNSNNNNNSSNNNINTSRILYTECALSLLSAPMDTAPANSVFSGFCMEEQQHIGNENVFVSDSGFHCQDLYHVGNEGTPLVEEGSVQALPFWQQ